MSVLEQAQVTILEVSVRDVNEKLPVGVGDRHFPSLWPRFRFRLDASLLELKRCQSQPGGEDETDSIRNWEGKEDQNKTDLGGVV